mmetsp:Transcript_136822/g.249421  ORF Transcript_136822/g.249421 Transcript_136822/m.249421 type:complete len:356 (+) Transcript_136822:93-1160(+)
MFIGIDFSILWLLSGILLNHVSVDSLSLEISSSGTTSSARRGKLFRRETTGNAADIPPSLEKEPRIPRQLILTGRSDSLQDMSVDVQQNVQLLLERNPDMRVQWFGDSRCAKYISKYNSKRLFYLFKHEPRGALRGDICRAAVLYREGGFYVDLDVDLRLPFHKLVDNSTTFMSVLESQEDGGGVLNAIMAVEPKSHVMHHLLRRLQKWYSHVRSGPKKEYRMALRMGPMTLRLAVIFAMAEACPGETIDERQQQANTDRAVLQWKCGAHAFRFYVQRRLRCKEGQSYGPEVCTPARMNASNLWQNWLDYGIFTPGSVADSKLIAFPHSEWCTELGCNAGGHDDDLDNSKGSAQI